MFNKSMFNKSMFNKSMFNKSMFNKSMFNKSMFNKNSNPFIFILIFIGICILVGILNFYIKKSILKEGMENNTNIIVTMTTIPERIEKGTIEKTLKSLSEQTLKPNIIYINVPPKTMKGVPYPRDKLKLIVEKYPAINIKINQVNTDLGPITKIIPTLPFIKDDDQVILVDDDVQYIPTMIEQLVNTKEPAVGYAGRTSDLEFKDGSTYSGPVAFLETYAGVLYSGKLLHGLAEYVENIYKKNDLCKKQDDIVIGHYLKTQNTIPVIASDLKHPGDHDAQDTPELRTDNLVQGNEKCYNYLFKS
jgi:hypothetical protein